MAAQCSPIRSANNIRQASPNGALACWQTASAGSPTIKSTYRGVSLEWVRTIGKHTFALNANYSETRTTNEDFFLTADDIEEEGEDVLFGGAVIDLLTLLEQNQRLEFAAPLLINASWTGLWLNDRLTSNVNLRYRSGFDRIEDTGVNEVVDVGGVPRNALARHSNAGSGA